MSQRLRGGQINIYAKDIMVLLNDFKQRFAYFAKANDEYGLAHLGQFLITSESV